MLKTKIVCTLGPATDSEEMITEMIKAGMNVARLNFSHGTHEEHKAKIDAVKAARDKLGAPVAIMLDTKGPEIRLGSFRGGSAELETGSEFTLTTRDVEGDERGAKITFAGLPAQVTEGTRILLDDGNIELTVRSRTDEEIVTTVTAGGVIKTGKGVNVPNVHLDMPHLSDRDRDDLLFGIENDVDFVSASFIRSAEDVTNMRKFLDYNGGHAIRIISKIENSEGVRNFSEILAKSDGIMVARGDMGVEIPFERLPGLQKRFIKECYRSGKMVITATQMLESMISHPHPTRAEITDVANAVFDGTSAVMLSGETAVGEYPLRAIEVMAKVAEQAERDAFSMKGAAGSYVMDSEDITNAVCDAACTTARDLKADAIVALTMTGRSARRMSKFRPSTPIVAATPNVKTFHQLALSWGVYPVLARNQDDFDKLFLHAIDCAKQIDIVSDGDRVVIVGGIPLDTPGNTNIIKVETVKSDY
ncbi:MAG: pyruvate kinase [Clostridia bacterium]|nr:pyruvate kinase [Clostridia bacterium]